MDASLNSHIVCRICYSNESKENLANWCNCSGTIGLMHKSCLERWIYHSVSISNWGRCEICRSKYDFRIEIVKPTFKQWLFRPIASIQDLLLLYTIIFFLITVPINCIYGNAYSYACLAFSTCSLSVTCYGHFYKWQTDNLRLTIRMKNEAKWQ